VGCSKSQETKPPEDISPVLAGSLQITFSQKKPWLLNGSIYNQTTKKYIKRFDYQPHIFSTHWDTSFTVYHGQSIFVNARATDTLNYKQQDTLILIANLPDGSLMNAYT